MIDVDTDFVGTLPDWKCAEDYDEVRELRSSEIAWQFLRRNPAFREDYEAIKTLYEEDPEQGRKLEEQLSEKYGLVSKPGIPMLNCGFANPHKTVPAPFFIVKDKPVTPIALKKWRSLENPVQYNREPEVPYEACIDIRLYLHAPYKEQEKRLKSIFNRFNASAKWGRRQTDDMYIEYLRILDALVVGATLTEIAEHLGVRTDFGDVLYDQFRKKKKRACQIMERDYMKIASIHDS